MSNKLTRDQVMSLVRYDELTGKFWWVGSRQPHMNGSEAGCTTKAGHKVLWLGGKIYTAQSVAWLISTGEWPTASVWHLNQDRSDNRMSNLVLLGTAPRIREQDLTHEFLLESLIYNPDTGDFFWRLSADKGQTRSGLPTGTQGKSKYAVVTVGGRRYPAHRVAWFYMHGEWPKDQIDHINRDKFDNRLANLRECSNMENCQNLPMRRDNSTGFVGVHRGPEPGVYLAGIGYKGKRIHLGTFHSAEAGYEAYCKAKADLHTFHPIAPAPRETPCSI